MKIIKDYYNIGRTVYFKFSNFEKYYEENMKTYFAKEIKKIEIKNNNSNQETTTSSNIPKELDNNIIKKYVYLLGNIPKDKFYSIFPLIKM